MRILVTGGAGYIGSVLVPKLCNLGYEVTVLDNFMFNQQSLLDVCHLENFHVVRGDVRNFDLLGKLVGSADLVIPLAALVGAPLCSKDPDVTIRVNQTSIEKLCNMVNDNQKIIMPVTNSGYGIGEKNKYCTEETPLNPISLYGVTKVNAEKAVLKRDNSITFRLATVFGMSPRMRTDLLVNDFVYRAINDRTVVIFEGHFKRNYIHIQDVCDVFIFAIQNFEQMKGKPYNVGLDSANLSKLELAKLIKEEIRDFVFLEAPIGEDPDKRDYIVSNERLSSAGFTPSRSVRFGIRELKKGYSVLGGRQHSNV